MNPTNASSHRARAMWAAAEPFVLGLLFAADGNDAVASLGVPPRAVYFTIRAAPLGRCSAAVVTAAFHGFPVEMITALLGSIWDRVQPEQVIAAHRDSLAQTAERVFADVDTGRVRRLGDLLVSACSDLDTSGRPLAAANQALDAPTEPWARFWHACNVLREYRGDGHIAALVAADLTVTESLVLGAAWARDHIDTDMLRTSRRLDEQVWARASDGLARRGFMTASGQLTAEGNDFRADIEHHTDIAASRPWDAIGPDNCADVYDLVRDLSAELVENGDMRAVTPVGAPWPPSPFVT